MISYLLALCSGDTNCKQSQITGRARRTFTLGPKILESSIIVFKMHILIQEIKKKVLTLSDLQTVKYQPS